jgi:DNA-binding LytR/AlgR family response regulator
MIRAIAVDDEIPALSVLENFCKRIDFIELQKLFNKPNDALRYLQQFPVDLIFLDINMPALTGINLYKAIQQNTMVVFTTAYSEFAVEGFNLNAIDYLLKPFTFERFMQAVNKVKTAAKLADDQKEKHLFIRADYSLIKIVIDDILFIEGLDDYLKIHIQNDKPVIARMTLKSILEKLPAAAFARVHRSYVVPLSRIKSVRNKIIYIDKEEIPVGNSYEENFLKQFNK